MIRNLLRNHLVFTMATNITLAMIGVVSGSLAARLLGPAGRGELAAIQTLPMFIASLAMLGLPEAIVYFSARRPERAGSYLGTAMLYALLTSLPFMALGYYLMPTLLAAQSDEVVAGARMFLLIVPLYATSGMLLHPLRGRNDLIWWNLMRLSAPLVWVFVLILAWRRDQTSPVWLAVGYLLGLALLFLPLALVVRARVPGPFKSRRDEVRPMLRFGIPLMAASVPAMLNLRLDQLLMAALLAPQYLGLYTAGVAWSAGLNPLLSAIGIVAFPRIAAQETGEIQAQTLAHSLHLGILMGLGLCTLALVLTPLAIPLLFGSDFRSSIPSAMILVVASYVVSINNILEEGARGLGDTKIVLIGELIGLCVTITALALLLAQYNIIGAALASFFGYSATGLSLLILVSRRTNYSLPMLIFPRRSDLSGFIQSARNLIRVRD